MHELEIQCSYGPLFSFCSHLVDRIYVFTNIVASNTGHSIHCPLGSQTFPEDPGDGGGRKQPGICIDRYVLEKCQMIIQHFIVKANPKLMKQLCEFSLFGLN